MVTLTETGTHSSIDASVGGFRGGEPELAIAMAGRAAGMLVIMDRGFPGVALWKAYTRAGAHLLIRARSSVARRPVTVLDDGTYLARMNLAGQKGAHPGGVLVRVIEYRVDGGEVIRLLTDLTDPAAFPAGELAALYLEVPLRRVRPLRYARLRPWAIACRPPWDRCGTARRIIPAQQVPSLR